MAAASRKARVFRGTKAARRAVTAAWVAKHATPHVRRYTLSVPPPSLNNAFYTGSDGARHASGRYKSWAKTAGWEIASQRPTPVAGPFCVSVAIGAGLCKADLDNMAKPIVDLLVTMGCVPDDRALTFLQMSFDQRPDVLVTVWTKGATVDAPVPVVDAPGIDAAESEPSEIEGVAV